MDALIDLCSSVGVHFLLPYNYFRLEALDVPDGMEIIALTGQENIFSTALYSGA